MKDYTYNFLDREDRRVYVTCSLMGYIQGYEQPGAIEGISIQPPYSARLDLPLDIFTKIALHHLREQGYLVLTPKEMAALGHLTPDDWRADQRGVQE